MNKFSSMYAKLLQNKAKWVHIVLLSFMGFVLVSCKKEITPGVDAPPAARVTNQLVMDSLYYYFKVQSYWTSSVENVNPISRFTDRIYNADANLITNAQTILSALKAQTPFYAGYNGPLDRFSFVEDVSAGSNSLRADKSDGYGIFETVVSINNARTGHIYISFVEGGSPAALAGIQRGDQIVAINEHTDLSVPLTAGGQPADRSALNIVSEALASSAFSIEIERDGRRSIYQLQYATYDIAPLMADTVFNFEGKKIGYFALSSFEQTNGAAGAALSNRIDNVFTRFENEGIDDLIVDFRYNIGGYVHAAEYLANKLINTEGNRQLMYRSDTNPALRRGEYAREFEDVTFEKSSTINPGKLYFLTGSNTASASELVISALMAHYNPNGNEHQGTRRLEIIGTPESIKTADSIPSTYGKPMGFFPETIMDRIDLWAASFKIVNARRYTDYWDGIPATYRTPVQDDVRYNFGDSRESMIRTALYHSLYNTYPPNTPTTPSRRAQPGSGTSKPDIIKIQSQRLPAPRELKKYR